MITNRKTSRTRSRTNSLIKRFIFFYRSSPNLQRQVTEYCIKKNHGNVHFTQTPEGRDDGRAHGVKWMGEAREEERRRRRTESPLTQKESENVVNSLAKVPTSGAFYSAMYIFFCWEGGRGRGGLRETVGGSLQSGLGAGQGGTGRGDDKTSKCLCGLSQKNVQLGTKLRRTAGQ